MPPGGLTDSERWIPPTVYKVLEEAAAELGLEKASFWFMIHVHTPGWLAGRREIKSFFIAEVDRDKVVIEGSG